MMNRSPSSSKLGLTLSALAISLFVLPFALHGQEKKNQSETKEKEVSVKDTKQGKDAELDDTEYEAGILIEYFRLDHPTANRLLSEYAPKAADAQGLRDELGKLIAEEKAELIETMWVRAMSGQRSKSESIREDIYPTEYDAPEIPNIVGNVGSTESKSAVGKLEAERQAQALREQSGTADPRIHMTSANPTAFETRNVGATLEVDPVIAENQRMIDLNLSPELVSRLEDRYFTREGMEETARGVEHIMMPTFYTMRVTTQVTAIPGNYNLLGIHTPHDADGDRILVLLKVDLIVVK